MTRTFFLHDLADRLDAVPSGVLRVGFSGGLDSTVLLHALAALPAAHTRGLGAIHVDHGLHPDAEHWADHCRRVCASLRIPLQVVRVAVEGVDEHGLEGAARIARDAAFTAHLPEDALLALAHHREDQAETVLLRLLHGAGHEGLAGMRALRAFAHGWLWRPLLETPREVLRGYATEHALQWIEDPSNVDQRHARNHLRHAVLPALATRWPDASRRIAAAAHRLREESDVLDDLARKALAAAQGVDPATLALPALRAMAPALRRAVIGPWLDQLGLPRPPPGVWARLGPDLLDAREDSAPTLAWRGAELRRYRDTVYALHPLSPADESWSVSWDGASPLQLPAGFGVLALEPDVQIETVMVRARRGGERLRQTGANRELRTLLQDLGVPPWVRRRLPLLVSAQGELLAAADLAIAPHFAEILAVRGSRLRWRNNPGIAAD